MSTSAPPDLTSVAEQDTQGHGSLGRRQVYAVAACYFVASFAALGLPPYLAEILPELGDPTAHWAGVLYVVPTVFGALGAPLWGRLADRYGRKRLLLRAQLGLALSFLLAGWADSLAAFTAALVLQGVLGGTFAASNGYLGAALEGPALAKALTLMQGSARAALVFAPILVGSLSPWLSPHRQYALLAVLPLAAAVMLSVLPEPGHRRFETAAEAPASAPAWGSAANPSRWGAAAKPSAANSIAAAGVMSERGPGSQGGRRAGTEVRPVSRAAAAEAPASDASTGRAGTERRPAAEPREGSRAVPPATRQADVSGQTRGMAGAAEPQTPGVRTGSGGAGGRPTAPLAGAPRAPLRALYALEFSFVFSTVISFPYLISLIQDRIPGTSPAVSGMLFALPHLCYLVAAIPVHAAFVSRPRLGIALGFACVALGLAGHGAAGSLVTFTAVRLLLGAGLTLGLVCLSMLAADCARGRAPGGMFGSLELVSKGGAVAAGVSAAAGNSWFGPTAPVLTGTAVAFATLLAGTLPTLNRRLLRTRWSR